MANKRIGQTTQKTTTLGTDKIPFERSNVMMHIDKSDFDAETQALIDTSIAALVDSSPTALDTLNELAAALGDDANFATTVMNALALKAPLASPTFTGTPAAPTAATGTSTTQIATTEFVQSVVSTITSDTYANWQTAKGSNLLPAGKWIFISDRNVYIFCITLSSFGLNGVFKNTVSSVDYYNACVYSFSGDYFISVRDNYYNDIYLTNPASFDFNVSNIQANRSSNAPNTFHVAGALGNVRANSCDNDSALFADGTLVGSTVQSNNLKCNGYLTVAGIGGTISNLDITTANITAVLDAGVTVEKCIFEHITATLDPTVNRSNQTCRDGFSNCDKSYAIAGLSTITFDPTYDNIIGIAPLTSSNPSESIIDFANFPINHPVRFYPEAGLVLTFVHGTSADQPRCSGSFNAVLDGTGGDWIEFTKNADGFIYQSNIFTA